MRLITSNIINEEVRGLGNLVIQPTKTLLIVRNKELYREVLEQKKDKIKTFFRDFPTFNLGENTALVEINHPIISRLQGVLYLSERTQQEEKELFYLNVGKFIPQYNLGKRPMSQNDEILFNQRIRDGERIKLSGNLDNLLFALDKSQTYTLTALNI